MISEWELPPERLERAVFHMAYSKGEDIVHWGRSGLECPLTEQGKEPTFPVSWTSVQAIRLLYKRDHDPISRYVLKENSVPQRKGKNVCIQVRVSDGLSQRGSVFLKPWVKAYCSAQHFLCMTPGSFTLCTAAESFLLRVALLLKPVVTFPSFDAQSESTKKCFFYTQPSDFDCLMILDTGMLVPYKTREISEKLWINKNYPEISSLWVLRRQKI